MFWKKKNNSQSEPNRTANLWFKKILIRTKPLFGGLVFLYIKTKPIRAHPYVRVHGSHTLMKLSFIVLMFMSYLVM